MLVAVQGGEVDRSVLDGQRDVAETRKAVRITVAAGQLGAKVEQGVFECDLVVTAVAVRVIGIGIAP